MTARLTILCVSIIAVVVAITITITITIVVVIVAARRCGRGAAPSAKRQTRPCEASPHGARSTTRR